MARLVGKIGLAIWAVAALLCATFDLAWASDARPTISIDGRAGTMCNSEPQWQIKHLCVVPMHRLMAFPERYNGKYIELRGFLVRKFDHVLLFNDRDSIAIFRYYEGVELITGCIVRSPDSNGKKVKNASKDDMLAQCRGQQYDLPPDVVSALDKGPVPALIIGSFDSTFQGELSVLGGLRDIKNVAIIVDIPEK
jgi:hypothetical protein